MRNLILALWVMLSTGALLGAQAFAEGNSFVLQSAPGDSVGFGEAYSYTDANAVIEPLQSYPQYLAFRVTGADSVEWVCTLHAPYFFPYGPGTYRMGERPESYKFNIIRRKNGVTTSSQGPGSFTIHKVIHGQGQKFESLWLSFELRIGDGEPTLRGEYKYRVDSTVTPLNRSPGVVAGSAKRVPMGLPVQLEGMANDDGVPSTSAFQTTWSMVDGPAAVEFTDPHDQRTTAVFSKVGSYTLRLTATDGALSNEATVSMVVFDPDERSIYRLAYINEDGRAQIFQSVPETSAFAAVKISEGVQVWVNGSKLADFRLRNNSPIGHYSGPFTIYPWDPGPVHMYDHWGNGAALGYRVEVRLLAEMSG